MISILALPHDIAVLGKWVGVGFLILNLPINLYAGTILSRAADYLERKQRAENNVQMHQGNNNHVMVNIHTLQPPLSQLQSQLQLKSSAAGEYQTVPTPQNTSREAARSDSPLQEEPSGGKSDYSTIQTNELFVDEANDDNNEECWSDEDHPSTTTTPQLQLQLPPQQLPQQQQQQQQQHRLHHDTATFDFIGMTSALFHNPLAARWVMILFYTNIFLVLGNYILVMSHAVTAMIGEDYICIPTAGMVAGTLMFAVSQLRTMAHLGRSVSIISLSAMAIVLVQCLYANHHVGQDDDNNDESVAALEEQDSTIMRKLSALGSIGFAVGSQKLFLNIRHELADRSTAPRSLAGSLSAFGAIYILVILKVLQNGNSKYTESTTNACVSCSDNLPSLDKDQLTCVCVCVCV